MDRQTRQSADGQWQELREDGYWYPVDSAPATETASVPWAVISPQTPAASSVPSGAWLVVIGGALSAIGCLLPWFDVHLGLLSANRNAFQLGDGQSVTWVGPIVVLLALVAVVIGIARLTASALPRGVQSSAITLGIVLAIVVGINYPTGPTGVNIGAFKADGGSFSVGFGVWLSLIGAVVVIGGGIVLRTNASLKERSVRVSSAPATARGPVEWPEGLLASDGAEGWYVDPQNPRRIRWWNGSSFTGRTMSWGEALRLKAPPW